MTEPVAPDTFDPYHKWLGISPKDQPPNHYKLLAIDRFEPDVDVIASAADKQMTHIRSYQVGKHSQLSQKILNEISKARICLLSADKKTEYDSYLRQKMAAAASASGVRLITAQAVPDESDGSQVDLFSVLGDAATSVRHSQIGSRSSPSLRAAVQPPPIKKPKAILLPLILLGSMASICVGAFVYVMMQPSGSHLAQTAPEEPAKGSVSPPLDTPKPEPKLKPPEKETQSPLAKPPSDVVPTPMPTPIPKPQPKPPVPKPVSKPLPPTPKPVIEEPTPAPKPVEVAEPKSPEELEKLLADATTPDDFLTTGNQALLAATAAVHENQPEKAKPLILIALTAARKARDPELSRRATLARINPNSLKETEMEP